MFWNFVRHLVFFCSRFWNFCNFFLNVLQLYHFHISTFCIPWYRQVKHPGSPLIHPVTFPIVNFLLAVSQSLLSSCRLNCAILKLLTPDIVFIYCFFKSKSKTYRTNYSGKLLFFFPFFTIPDHCNVFNFRLIVTETIISLHERLELFLIHNIWHL